MKLTGLAQMFDIDPLSTSTVQQHQLGTIAYDSFGNMYRYAKAGAVALVKGNLLQAPARDTQFTGMAVQAAAAAGQNVISFTNGTTTIAAGDFSDGMVAVRESNGIGQTFRIKNHGTGTSGATISLTTYENILTALTTSSKITITPNHYNGVIVSPTTRTGKTVGVALSAIAIGGFGWIGVKGLFAVLSDSTVAAVGEGLSPSTTTAGCVTKAVTLLERIGTAPILGVSAKDEPAYIDCP